MSNKTYPELATEVTIAWLEAKTELAVSGAGNATDREFPSEEKLMDFYKDIYNTIKNNL